MELEQFRKTLIKILPGHNNDVFCSTVDGFLRIGFGVRKAARLMGVKAPSVCRRVERKTIQHFTVNGRVFIDDLAIAAKGKTGLLEVSAFKLELPEWNWTMVVYSKAALDVFIDYTPVGVALTVTKIATTLAIDKKCLRPATISISVKPAKFIVTDAEGTTAWIEENGKVKNIFGEGDNNNVI